MPERSEDIFPLCITFFFFFWGGGGGGGGGAWGEEGVRLHGTI